MEQHRMATMEESEMKLVCKCLLLLPDQKEIKHLEISKQKCIQRSLSSAHVFIFLDKNAAVLCLQIFKKR